MLKKRGERPPIQFGDDNPLKDDPMQASLRYREENTKKEIMQHVIFISMNDGVIDQGFINKVLQNFGIVPENHEHHQAFCDVSGVVVGDMYEIFQLEDKDEAGQQQSEVSLDGYVFSPARMVNVLLNKKWKPAFTRRQRLARTEAIA